MGTEIVEALLALPEIVVNVQDQDEKRHTPLHIACKKRHINIVKALLSHPKIDVNVQDQDGETPLHLASDLQPPYYPILHKEGHIDIVKALLAHPEIDVNIQDIYGLTPLHYACGIPLRWYKMPCHLLILTHLLEHPEIDVNIQEEDGKTPLHVASERGLENYLKVLLAHPEIDLCIRDNKGKTAFDDSFFHSKTKNFIKKNEQQATEEYCLAMIQPDLPVVSSRMTRKRKAKELRRDELRLGPELIKSIATYLEWKDISKKSCFEVMKKKKKN